MSKYIKPVLNFSSSASNVTSDPGPSAFALALSTTPTADTKGRLTVGVTDHWTGTVSVVSADGGNAPAWGRAELKSGANGYNTLVDGSAAIATATSTSSALTGCWIYIKNQMTAGNEVIWIGHTTDADATQDGEYYAKLTADNLNTRIFTLKAGEFAFFPYDFTGDLYIDASAAGQKYEFWRFERA